MEPMEKKRVLIVKYVEIEQLQKAVEVLDRTLQVHLYLKQFENQTWFQSLFATSQIDGTLNKKVPDHKQSIFEETFFKIKEPE